MIAIDTNVLVYARRAETQHHQHAFALLHELAEGESAWAIPWPCIYEYLRVVTHARVFDPPTDLNVALEDLESLFDSPHLVMIGEGSMHRTHLVRNVLQGRATGNLIHDAHIAALALEHGVSEFLTADRDFARFSTLRCRNPFLDVTP